MTQDTLQAVATILSLVNPAMCAAIFLRSESGRTAAQRTADAVKAVAAITTILVLAAFGGLQVLGLFGVSLDAFSVAGGLILVVIGSRMMLPAGTSTNAEPGQDEPGESGAESKESPIAPLILFAASPGTITGVISVSVAHTDGATPTTALIAIAATMGVLAVVLLAVARSSKTASEVGLARRIVTSYMGLIVIAMGIQFAMDGWRQFMAP
jgi:multiple antibiotic resistance protein